MFTPTDLHLRMVGWQLSEHAKDRARRRGVGVARIVTALTDPDLTYPRDRETIMVRGRLAVVTNPRTRMVLTVLVTGEDVWDDAQARVVFAAG